MRPQMLCAHGKAKASFSAVAIVAMLVGSSVACGTAAAQSSHGDVQQCSCSLLTGLWNGYRGSGKNSCDDCDAGCEPVCGCEAPTCGCDQPSCGIEQPACGCEATCDGGCDGGCSSKKGCGLLSGSSGLMSKFKSKLTTMLRPTPSDCNCCSKNTPCQHACGCGKKPQAHSNANSYRHSEPQPMFVPPAPMIVEPIDSNMNMETMPHRHLEESALPAPKADMTNDPFRDDSVRVRRTAVPQKHAPVSHVESTTTRNSSSQSLRPAVYEQAASGDRWTAPLHIASMKRK
ncbi:hypothetical protein Poly24_20270 [Rosistilla carotiformis]|uniref:Stigma-specific protein, Stig1 n=1 Tax=Rosistilla carotiformis TaxID=2528017 RepID=A0A518JS05_9BACT|nr:hypothetical protein [Rosistilla carotiformis]QDV68318.1 hypothetical protein Poly24_20270 [Rosistilla carotiformis]